MGTARRRSLSAALLRVNLSYLTGGRASTARGAQTSAAPCSPALAGSGGDPPSGLYCQARAAGGPEAEQGRAWGPSGGLAEA